MSKIQCDVINCSHNKENTCYSNFINVGGKSAKKNEDTCCGSFLDSKNYSRLTNNVNEQGGACTAIACNVSSCNYNSNSTCNAKTIYVGGDHVNIYTETQCQTFEKK